MSAGHQEPADKEYVLLELDDVFHGLAFPANTPYTISGLDTLNPVLVIGGHKLIGEYVDTVGTCFVFSEQEKQPRSEVEIGSDEPAKQFKDVCRLEKKLKFRRLAASDKSSSSQPPVRP